MPLKQTLILAQLYPEQMNIYGDRGNIIALAQRCAWRGISLKVIPVDVDTDIAWETCDLAFFGGGQDSGQALVANDFLKKQGAKLGNALEDGLVMLAICGGYQLLGHYFLTHDGQRLPGLGILDVHTIGGKKRLIGNCVVSGALEKPEKQHALPFVGFENHSGRTYHGPKVRPLGQVLVGYGDNAEDRKAGAVYRNIIGCYLHGPLLPKNPQLADHLILQALRRKYDASVTLSPLDDTLELQAQQTMVKRLGC